MRKLLYRAAARDYAAAATLKCFLVDATRQRRVNLCFFVSQLFGGKGPMTISKSQCVSTPKYGPINDRDVGENDKKPSFRLFDILCQVKDTRRKIHQQAAKSYRQKIGKKIITIHRPAKPESQRIPKDLKEKHVGKNTNVADQSAQRAEHESISRPRPWRKVP